LYPALDMSYDFRQRVGGQRDLIENFRQMVLDIERKTQRAKANAGRKVLSVAGELLDNFGLKLDLNKSWIERYDIGSDSHGIMGGLVVAGDLDEEGVKGAIWDAADIEVRKCRRSGDTWICEFDTGG
jgi:hypothetical protein